MPGNMFFTITVEVMFLTMLAFLFLLNAVLARLAAMLPDEPCAVKPNSSRG